LFHALFVSHSLFTTAHRISSKYRNLTILTFARHCGKNFCIGLSVGYKVSRKRTILGGVSGHQDCSSEILFIKSLH